MNVNQVFTVCSVLQPNMAEYADGQQMMHWMDYALELDEITFLAEADGLDKMITYINTRMGSLISTHPAHEACTDVASTLQNLYPVWRNKFKF